MVAEAVWTVTAPQLVGSRRGQQPTPLNLAGWVGARDIATETAGADSVRSACGALTAHETVADQFYGDVARPSAWMARHLAARRHAAAAVARVASLRALLLAAKGGSRTMQGAAKVLVGILRRHEPSTAEHCRSAQQLAARLGRAIRLPERDQTTLELSALLHDVGKVGVPVPLLLKCTRLSPAEWVAVRAHPSLGAQMVEGVSALASLTPAIRHHHERWDGTGYPDGLAGSAIPLPARLIAVADAYTTLCAGRPYQRPRDPESAIEEIRRGFGSQFDPALTVLVPALRSFESPAYSAAC